MAAGLPVIASDWNGYRDTVVHERTGLLIPTQQPGPDASHYLADLANGRISYDEAMAVAMRQVVVEEEPLVAALDRLLSDASLRQRFGEAGQRRARELDGWQRVARQISALLEELTQRRLAGGGAPSARPLSPWQMFSSWPTHQRHSWGSLQITPDRLAERLHQHDALKIYASLTNPAHPALHLPALKPLIQHLRQRCARHSSEPFVLDAGDLVVALPSCRQEDLQQAISWLAKIGAVDLPT
jgi:hypothetical protein